MESLLDSIAPSKDSMCIQVLPGDRQKPLSLEVISELDKLYKCRTMPCVEAASAPQPGTLCATQQCSVSIAWTSTDCVLCPVQSKINKMWCLYTEKQKKTTTKKNNQKKTKTLSCLLIKMTGSASGIGSASGQMRRKLESALGSVPNLLRKKSLNLSPD